MNTRPQRTMTFRAEAYRSTDGWIMQLENYEDRLTWVLRNQDDQFVDSNPRRHDLADVYNIDLIGGQ